MDSTLVELQDRIFVAIDSKRWTQLEEAWKEVLDQDPPASSFHEPIIDRLIRKQDPSRFTDMYDRWLAAAVERGEGQKALDVINFITSKYTQAEWLRPHVVGAVKQAFGPSAGGRIQELLNESGLEDETSPLQKAYQRFHDLIGATKGQVFLHRTWGLGVVKELDIIEGKVLIDFETRKHQTLTLEGVRNFLTRIPPDHVRARIALDPDGLRDELKDDPAAVIRQALKSARGRMKVAELKKLLTDRFLTESEYKSFWAQARGAIKLDPWIDQSGTGVHSELRLRDTPRGFFDSIFAELLKSTCVSDRFQHLRDVRRHGADADMTQQDSEALYQLFLKTVSDGSLPNDAARLNHGLLMVEFNDLFEGRVNPIPVDALLLSANHLDLLRGVEIHELRRAALDRVFQLYPENEQWGEIFAEVILSVDTRTAAWMDAEMKKRGEDHYRQVAFEMIVAKPDANPDLFTWAAKNILEGKWKALAETLPPIMIFEELLSLLAELQDTVDSDPENGAAAKNAGTKIRALINDNNSRQFKNAVSKATVEEARRILQDIRLHNGLSHQMKANMEGILMDAHEELRKSSRSEDEEEKRRPAYHYTTRASLDAKRTELSNIMSVEIPEAAVRIDVARQMGDLKENAEYHAAKDYQKLLMQRAAELEDLIARARLVEPRDVVPDNTRFGTTAHLREVATGKERRVTLLGMWEGDSSRDIISYLTPFGSQLLSRRVGDKFVVTAQDGTETEFEVLGIESALETVPN